MTAVCKKCKNALLFCCITLLLFGASCEKSGSQPLSTSAVLEVYQVAPSAGPGTRIAVDPDSGANIYLMLPPVITSTDVAGIERRNSADTNSLTVHLTPGGTTKLTAATTPATGQQLAFVVNGHVVGLPKVRTPISSGAFNIAGGRVYKDREQIFAALTEERATK